MLQLANGLSLNLPDALASDLKDPAHFFQRVCVTVAQAVPQLDDLALAIGQCFEDLLDLVLEHFLSRGTDGGFGPVVLDEVAEIAVFTFAHGPIETDRMAANLED